MTQLEHLQKVILSIAKDIDELCQKNSINYYLLGGSAIGAIRHKGFIPWDDDLDIIMDSTNYEKFIKVCREQLDMDKYYLQVGLEDWPLYFSKIKLRGTVLEEYEAYTTNDDMKGIYVDVFKMDNISSNPLMARWQYLCGKYYLCYQLSQRTYTSASFKKRLMIALSFPCKLSFIRRLVKHQVEKYNNKNCEYLGFFYGRTKFKSAVVKKYIFGTPKRVPFEDTELPVAEHYHEYLTQVFGDYMQLPPEEKRVGLHLLSVDFGEY